MAHYIDKAALVAEIEKKIKQYEDAFNNPSFASCEASLIAKGKYRKLLDILQFINTLEVKEVDLDKEIDENYQKDTSTLKTKKQYAEIAKHFFELGIRAAQKAE